MSLLTYLISESLNCASYIYRIGIPYIYLNFLSGGFFSRSWTVQEHKKNSPDLWPKSGGYFDAFITYVRSLREKNIAKIRWIFIAVCARFSVRSVRFHKIRRTEREREPKVLERRQEKKRVK